MRQSNNANNANSITQIKILKLHFGYYENVIEILHLALKVH